MAKTEPYHPGTTPAAQGPSGIRPQGVVRTVLWTVVVISVTGNAAASYGGAHTWVHLACGLVTALGAGMLVVRGLRGRR